MLEQAAKRALASKSERSPLLRAQEAAALVVALRACRALRHVAAMVIDLLLSITPHFFIQPPLLLCKAMAAALAAGAWPPEMAGAPRLRHLGQRAVVSRVLDVQKIHKLSSFPFRLLQDPRLIDFVALPLCLVLFRQ